LKKYIFGTVELGEVFVGDGPVLKNLFFIALIAAEIYQFVVYP
jgi:hypothetical protein